MQRSIYRIEKMDCPSEEQMIRMKLADLNQIALLEFDIPGRSLMVTHQGDPDEITLRIDTLQLNAVRLTTEPAGDVPALTKGENRERKLLWQVLIINLFFFVLELTTGLISRSMGLVADSLDMLADALVYGMALMAVGGSAIRKKRVARYSGYFQIFLAALGLLEVLRRFFGFEGMPHFQTMIGVSLLALAGNAVSLYLLQKSRSKEAHMQASMIFTSNDIMANLGVIIAALLVMATRSVYPDLIIGVLVFGLVGRGALRILALSR